MKTPLQHGLLLLALIGMFSPASLRAQPDRPAAGERLDRMERQLDELANRQEQLMRRMGAQLNRQSPNANPAPALQNPPPPLPDNVAPANRQPGPEGKMAKDISGLIGLLCLIGLICNILLAIWIYTDIRKRNEGSGIFVAMAIIAGIPAALIYALTRIGDKKT